MKPREVARALLRAVGSVLRAIGRVLHLSLRVMGWLFVIAVLSLGGLGVYAYRRFSPEDARRLAAEQLSALLRREVDIDRLVLSPHGLKVIGLRVRRGGSEPDFLSCDSVLVVVRLRPLLDKRVEIDSVRLESPQIALLRDATGHWDISDIFVYSPAARGSPGGLLPQALATAQVVVDDGVLRIDDRERGRRLSFERLALSFHQFSLDHGFPVTASFSKSHAARRARGRGLGLRGRLGRPGGHQPLRARPPGWRGSRPTWRACL